MLSGDATDYYRCSGVLEYINDPQIDFKPLRSNISIGWETLVGLDVLVFQRPFTETHSNIIRLAKDMNIKVIIDYDDDLFSIPAYNASYTSYTSNKQFIEDCISLSDEVWVSTKAIKNAFKKLNDNITVIPNAHNDFMFPVSQKRDFNYKTELAVYRGGASHQEDVYYHQAQLLRAIKQNPDWEFRFIGHSYPAIAIRTAENHTYTTPLTIIQFFKYLHDINPNILFFPLIENAFNNAKSNISWLEGTYAGACVFTNTKLNEFNKDLMLDMNVFMKENDKDVLDFYNRTSWDYIQENLLLSQINKLRIESLLK